MLILRLTPALLLYLVLLQIQWVNTWDNKRNNGRPRRGGEAGDGRGSTRIRHSGGNSPTNTNSNSNNMNSQNPVYEKLFRHGMNCDFEDDSCAWGLYPNQTKNKDGSDGLTRMRASTLKEYILRTSRKIQEKEIFQYFTDASHNPEGSILVFQANYKNKSNKATNHSFIVSPWIEETMKYCTLSFHFLSTVAQFKLSSNDHSYMETMLVTNTHGYVPLSPRHVKHHNDTSSAWVKVEYEIGVYQRFRFEISFFKGIDEKEPSVFAIDDLELKNCLKMSTNKPVACNPDTEYKCHRSGKCVSRSIDLCDYRNDCPLGDDETLEICDAEDNLSSGYRCDFSRDLCGWTPSGPMRWERIKDEHGKPYLNLDIAKYRNEHLVTLGILRSPEFTPPPAYVENHSNPATFQSCALRLFFKATKIEKVDFFEIEIIEKKPLTKESRGSSVRKPVSKKMKTFTQTNPDTWTKIEAIIPKGMKYKYLIQLNAVKAPDTSGPAQYNMSVANITLSPQCFGLGVENASVGPCWRHDLALYPRELAECMGVEYGEDTSLGVFSYPLTTCAENVGPRGPWKEDCSSYYEYQAGNVTFVDMLTYDQTIVKNQTSKNGGEIGLHVEVPPVGVQKWTVPQTGVYTIIAKGASGGHGRLSKMSSTGAIITAIVKLEKDDVLYIVVGQEGQSACVIQGVESRDGLCAVQDEDTFQTSSLIYDPGQYQGLTTSFHARSRREASYEDRYSRLSSFNSDFFPDSYGFNGYFRDQEAFVDTDSALEGGRRSKQRPGSSSGQDAGKQSKKRRRRIRNKQRQASQEQTKRTDGYLGDEAAARVQQDRWEDDQYDDYEDGVKVIKKPPNTKCEGDSCKSWIDEINTYHPSYQSGGGGGGGATIIFKVENGFYLRPILVAGGGGGKADLSGANNADANKLFDPDTMKISDIVPPFVERGIDIKTSTDETQGGHGGGWNTSTSIDRMSYYWNKNQYSASGGTVVDMWAGGYPCNYRPLMAGVGDVNDVYTARWGGFGGGGGGCKGGGGGGGFIGGKGGHNGSENGEGGWSYVDREFVIWYDDKVGKQIGPGEVFIIPNIADVRNQTNCKCHDDDSMCMAINEIATSVRCYCSRTGKTVDVNIPCYNDVPVIYMIILVIGCIVVAAIFGLLCMCLYTQYQRKRLGLMRNKLRGADGQLNRLRSSNGFMMTEYNPNYEFGGGTCNIMDLREVDRENLRLVKALGQGAFGEVYQGYFKKSAADQSETPVAVKTLPELSTNQAEMDFLMEALIMSKFNHTNIVQFIGVCFDKHPRFIILELLAGGDLKTFLRESRPKPDRATTLAMIDLLNAAIDVAKGCKYLEENHFIHRDIAARNCLLTSKGPGRIVKIADFGMARDIYRADYYRKGGKAMLPVKWMPPEAFLDGIFTSKTDIWSFGILLWEVMSLGYMPYPGRGNQEVMQLVTNGGRLEPPNYCPGPLYGLMCQCWHPIPEERPNFHTILERLGYCLQDPEVVKAPLPVFHRPQSSSTYQDKSISSRRDGEGNSSGNSGSGGSVSIGPPARINNPTNGQLAGNGQMAGNGQLSNNGQIPAGMQMGTNGQRPSSAQMASNGQLVTNGQRTNGSGQRTATNGQRSANGQLVPEYLAFSVPHPGPSDIVPGGSGSSSNPEDQQQETSFTLPPLPPTPHQPSSPLTASPLAGHVACRARNAGAGGCRAGQSQQFSVGAAGSSASFASSRKSGGYSALPTAEPENTVATPPPPPPPASHHPHHLPGTSHRPRWNSSQTSLASSSCMSGGGGAGGGSSAGDQVSESKSTEPLLLAEMSANTASGGVCTTTDTNTTVSSGCSSPTMESPSSPLQPHFSDGGSTALSNGGSTPTVHHRSHNNNNGSLNNNSYVNGVSHHHMDLDDIPPPPRPYSGPPPPPLLPPPPPQAYSDHTLPLNPARLGVNVAESRPPPTSYANIGVQGGSPGDGYNNSEISV